MNRRPRTYDAATGTDYVDHRLNDEAAPPGMGAATDAAGSPAMLPEVTVTATPLSTNSGPFGLPWWVWGMLGLGVGYFIARQYGHKLARGLAPVA